MPPSKEIGTFKKQIAALSRISQAVSSNLLLEDVLRLIVMVMADVMDSKICSLMLVDEKKQELVVRATQSISAEYNQKPNLKIGEGISGRVVEEKKPVSVLDVKRDPRYRNTDIAIKEGLCSLLSVPLTVRGKIIGVLNCYTHAIHNFTETEIAVVATVAAEAAMVIDQHGLLERSRSIQEELETRKLVERAKDMLSRDAQISGEEAYRRMQKQSMNARKSMREIAEAVILSKSIKR
ncbi:MAG: GAF and ANTAR domain-containing protein [bacterium]|nr:GAF and ANTAR domain-containing protein [bacterium]MDD5353839.1 GAF and ANTAR domain-containing protein [bacterium]MDD5756711.1 GAF and ANTAR domain-containing protein [bacterium]